MLTGYLNHSFHCGFGSMSGVIRNIACVCTRPFSQLPPHGQSVVLKKKLWTVWKACPAQNIGAHSKPEINYPGFLPTAHPSEETGRHSRAPYNEVWSRPALTKNRIPIWAQIWTNGGRDKMRGMWGLANMVTIFIHSNMQTSVFKLFEQFLHKAYF